MSSFTYPRVIGPKKPARWNDTGFLLTPYSALAVLLVFSCAFFAAHRWRILSEAAFRCAAENLRLPFLAAVLVDDFTQSGMVGSLSVCAALPLPGGRPRRFTPASSAWSALSILSRSARSMEMIWPVRIATS